VDELRFSVDVPEPPDESVTLDVLSDAVRLLDDELELRATVPVNPPRLARLIVELPDPTSILIVVGLDVRLKSGTLTVMVAVCDREPVVAVIVIVYVPGVIPVVVENVSSELPEPPPVNVTLVGFRVTVGPDGDTVVVSETLLDRPLILARLTVEFTDVPGGVVWELGLVDIEKSTTWTVTWMECVSDPLVPVIVTV